MRPVYFLKTFSYKTQRTLRTLLSLFVNFLYDALRSYFFSIKAPNKQKIITDIIKIYHVLEKGMTLPEPSPWFGLDKAIQLANEMKTFLDKYSKESYLHEAYKVLISYVEFQSNKASTPEQKIKIDYLTQAIKSLETLNSPKYYGGAELIRHSDRFKIDLNSLEFLFKSRHSTRNFSQKPIDTQQIELAIQISQYTPSVCNRQGTRIHLYTDRKIIKNLLSFQNGNRGFTDSIPALLIISHELSLLDGVAERNQWGIDGGMRCMSLIMALHGLGLGSCCLNWCVSARTDLALRKHANIPNSESIITMMAVGHLPEENYYVTYSPREATNKILKIHN